VIGGLERMCTRTAILCVYLSCEYSKSNWVCVCAVRVYRDLYECLVDGWDDDEADSALDAKRAEVVDWRVECEPSSNIR
jgi:hypothetical protein